MSKFSVKLIWRTIVLGLLACLITLVVAVYFLAAPRLNPDLFNGVLFHPYKLKDHAPEMTEIAGIKAEESSIKSGDYTVNALFYKNRKAADVVLINHGNAGHLDVRRGKIETLLNSNVSVLAYDYRGFGKSDGKPDLPGAVTDGLSAFDFLVNEKSYSPKSIILYGESLGTGVSTEIARKRECKAIILESGFMSPESLGKEKVPFLHIYPSFLMFEPALNNLSYARGKHPPILLIAGQKDSTIPCHHSKTIYAEATQPKTLVVAPNSSHNDFSADIQLYRSAIADFFRSCQPLAGVQ